MGTVCEILYESDRQLLAAGFDIWFNAWACVLVLKWDYSLWASGGTGIRVRLRTVFRKDWGFESPLAHQF